MANDKLYHIIANAFVGFFAGQVTYLLCGSLLASLWCVLCACVPMSVTKEVMDEKTPGNKWSWGDIGADFIGMALVAVWLILFHYAKG